MPQIEVNARAVDLPGRGAGAQPDDVTISQCIDFVAQQARALSSPPVLVGHSFSAQVALGVASAYPQLVAGLALVGGVFPESGKSFMSILPLPQRLILGILLRRARGGIELPLSLVRKEYCSDLDEATTELVLSKIVPEAPRLYLDPVDWAGIPQSMPRHYVKLLDDRSVPPKQQDRMIQRAGATRIVSVPGGHLAMLSQPQEMAAALNRLAGSRPEGVE